MENTYGHLINQNLKFPQEGFELIDGTLHFHGVNIMELIEEYGTPLKLTHLDRIGQQIEKARSLFKKVSEQEGYTGSYTYCYCTKSSHFKYVLDEVLKHRTQLETSSEYDIHIIRKLIENGQTDKSTFLIHNGYKPEAYLLAIAGLINDGYNSIPVLDNAQELEKLAPKIEGAFNIGIRIATGEEPQSNYYSSRHGIRHREIISHYKDVIAKHPNVKLKMLHFFIDNGIEDSAYYWNELNKCLQVYSALKKECDSLTSLNLGGGLPVRYSLASTPDHEGLIRGIIISIKQHCDEEGIPHPDLFTEFGTYTVAESGATIYQVIDQKKQNDMECWNLIDSSFITTLPDTWAINQRFILLAINNWDQDYERVNLGGLTCDQHDYYNFESHDNSIFLPKFNSEKPLYIGFFHTGAYQHALGGYGGIQHCLIPSPKQILVRVDENGRSHHERISDEQEPSGMMGILGY